MAPVRFLSVEDPLHCNVVVSMLTGARTEELRPVIQTGTTVMDDLFSTDAKGGE